MSFTIPNWRLATTFSHFGFLNLRLNLLLTYTGTDSDLASKVDYVLNWKNESSETWNYFDNTCQRTEFRFLSIINNDPISETAWCCTSILHIILRTFRASYDDKAFVILILGYPAGTSGGGIQLLCCRSTELEGIWKGEFVPALVCIKEQYRKRHHGKEKKKIQKLCVDEVSRLS